MPSQKTPKMLKLEEIITVIDEKIKENISILSGLQIRFTSLMVKQDSNKSELDSIKNNINLFEAGLTELRQLRKTALHNLELNNQQDAELERLSGEKTRLQNEIVRKIFQGPNSSPGKIH